MDLNKIKNKSDNFYSQALFGLGWVVIVLGIIGSFVLATSYSSYYSDFNGTVFFIGLFSTAFTGFLILGLAEIISILNDNRRLLAAMTQNVDKPSIGNDSAMNNSIAEELPEI